MKKIFVFFFILTFGLFSTSYAEENNEIVSANFLASKGFISDNSNNPTNYRLNETITRKEMIKIVVKVAGLEVEEKCEKKFSDVSEDWGCKYIESALKAGFISFNNGVFRPDENITKTESLKLVFKARGIQKLYNTSHWQEDYMKTAFDLGLITAQYSDYNTNAFRGWIFIVIAKTYEDIKNTIYSDEANIQ
ncbi:S-layer homology domain-containing protein [Candidatus Gracilibacteria bacterium]|nr:S-layer homology domain-containing protein [Candidatus Gracilibacteria bacterium]NUJ99235.1 S-layer homology domain-containing protein [Candidatus Gracilibacteria bacterium]